MRVVQQNVYKHGGSRIFYDDEQGRELLVDTYGDKEMALAVMEFVKQYLIVAGDKEQER